MKDSGQREMALLALEYREAMQDAAKFSPEAIAQIDELYALRRRAIGGAAAAADVAVRGTFQAAGAWGMGAGNAADRTAKATERTADYLARLLAKGAVYVT